MKLAKIAFKKALEQQALKNKPELASFESVLALRIIGVKGEMGYPLLQVHSLGPR